MITAFNIVKSPDIGHLGIFEKSQKLNRVVPIFFERLGMNLIP